MGKYILWAIGAFVGLILLSILGAVMGIVTIPWLKFTKQIDMNREIVDKTYTAENALYNYHWFKERTESIKATESKIKIAKESVIFFEESAGKRVDWSFEDKTEHARLSAVYQGLRSQYEDLVAEYNAKAKEADRNIFKDELPLFINLQPF